MIVSFQLSQQDFLRYQLFTASQSKQLNRFRLRKRLVLPVVFVFFGILFLFVPLTLKISFFCSGAALVWFVFYPVWDRQKYRKRFQKFVNKNYQSRFEKEVSVELKEREIIGNDNGFEIVVSFGDLQEIVVIPELIMLKIDEERVMLVASQKIASAEKFEQALKELADKWKVPFIVNKSWKW